jgi:DNA mismatch repair protein MutS2
VHTPLGKGLVREILNGGRVRVDIGARTLVFRGSELSRVDGTRPTTTKRLGRQNVNMPATSSGEARLMREVDLHGLTVEKALSRLDDVLNDAILRGVAELRIIHGRSGGRIRGAVHMRLREMSTVLSFRLDPENPGVTIASL